MRELLVRNLGLNRAVVFSVLAKSWQAAAGLVGLLLVGMYFSPNVQGYYYTFASLVALQSFAELGLYLVVSSCASHEWAKLEIARDGTITGNVEALSRLVSLGRFVFRWYAAAASLFFLLAGAGGYWFLHNGQVSDVDWKGPWLCHVAFSALLLWCAPFLSLLEGCEQVAPVAKLRLWQVLASNVGFWIAVVAGANLWAAPVLSAVSAAISIFYLTVFQRRFFKPFLQSPQGSVMDWKGEVLPMQWRLATQGVMNYFVFSLFTPVMFYYHGPVQAGQMGMTLQAVTAVQAIASMWILTKGPRLGVLVARRSFDLLDHEWRKAALLSVYMMLLGAAFMIGVVYTMQLRYPALAARVLPPLAFFLLATGAVFSLGTQTLSVYLRAHKRDVFTPLALVTGAAMGLMVWQLGAHFGPLGACASFMFVMVAITFPLSLAIWKKARRDWH